MSWSWSWSHVNKDRLVQRLSVGDWLRNEKWALDGEAAHMIVVVVRRVP